MADVKAAYRWSNNMLMVFGFDGQQIPELQGEWSEELEGKIRQRSRSDTAFNGFGSSSRCVWNAADVRNLEVPCP